MTSVSLDIPQTLPLLGTSDSGLDDNSGACDQLPGFHCNLLRQFSRGRNDESSDVVGSTPGSSPAAHSLREIGIDVDDVLQDGKEESHSFTSTRLCLRNDIRALDRRVDGLALNLGHSLQSHASQILNDVAVDDVPVLKLLELGDRRLLLGDGVSGDSLRILQRSRLVQVTRDGGLGLSGDAGESQGAVGEETAGRG